MFDARAAGRELVPARWIEARNIRWTITDLDLSPDGRFLAYSSIGSSSSANVCSIAGDSEQHERLAMYSQGESFAVYSVRWGGQREVVAGCNDCHLRAFDLERQTTTLDVNAHEDDVNACSIADGAFQSSVVVTGSDDATIKVWDRRMLGISGAAASPQGVLVGHTEGITFLSAKGDGRYMLSNSKDQSAKLWDLRALRSPAQAAALTPVPRRHRVWDYRRSEYPNVLGRNADGTPWPTPHHRHPDDTSLMTYRGHKVHYTLIRCHFSPAESTAHKFVYSGSADGRVHIYDTLTGEVEAVLVHGQDRRDVAAVRDVAWHPWQPLLCTAAWDGRVTRWDAQCEAGSLTARLRRGASAASRTAAGARPGGTAGASSEPTPTPCLREERACTSKEPTGGQKLSRVYKVLRDSDACESEVCARAPSCAPSDQARPDVLEMYVQLLLSTLSARSPRVLSQPVSAGLCGVPSCAAGNQRTWLLH